MIRAAGVTGSVDEQLVLAADQFAITTGDRPTAVAGYPWFGEWSRDLMTSYEGLYLSTGRADEGREVLRTSAATVSEGMLANTADTGSLEYNTVDGTLWFVHAVGRHVAVTGDDRPRPRARAGARRDRRSTTSTAPATGSASTPPTACLRQGAEGWALTWMDARVDGRPITPRAGKPVEVNALWIARARRSAEALGRTGPTSTALRAQAHASFVQRFVRPDGRGLFDVVDGPGGDDASVRPNQLLAVSLPGGPLPLDAARSVGRASAATSCSRRSGCGRCRRRSRLPPAPPRLAARARRGLPPGHGLALAARAVRRCGTCGRRPARATRSRGSRAISASGGSARCRRRPTAPCRTLATGCPFQAWSVAEVLRVRREPAAVPQPPARPRAAARQAG